MPQEELYHNNTSDKQYSLWHRSKSLSRYTPKDVNAASIFSCNFDIVEVAGNKDTGSGGRVLILCEIKQAQKDDIQYVRYLVLKYMTEICYEAGMALAEKQGIPFLFIVYVPDPDFEKRYREEANYCPTIPKFYTANLRDVKRKRTLTSRTPEEYTQYLLDLRQEVIAKHYRT